MNGDPTKPKYTLEQDLDLLLDRNFDSQRVVEIMQSNGYDPNDVVNTINTRYETQRKEQLAQQEERDRLDQQHKSAWEQALKKKDLSEPDGEPSRFGLDSIGQETQAQPEPAEAVALPPAIKDQVFKNDETYFDVLGKNTIATKLAIAAKKNDVNAINENLELMQQSGLMTDINIEVGGARFISSKGGAGQIDRDAYSLEMLSKIEERANEIAANSANKYEGVLNFANSILKDSGSDFRYNPSSQTDFNLYGQQAYERYLNEEKEVQKDVDKLLIDSDVNLDLVTILGHKIPIAYKTNMISKSYKDAIDKIESTFSNMAIWQSETLGKISPLNYIYNSGGNAAERHLQNVERIEAEKSKRRDSYARVNNIDQSVLNLGFTERLEAAHRGEIDMSQALKASALDSQEFVVDGTISVLEMLTLKGVPMLLDAASSNYVYNRRYKPHMGVIENTLNSGIKGGLEFGLNKAFMKLGVGAEASVLALKNVGAKALGKELAKKGLKKASKAGVGKAALNIGSEGLEEAGMEIASWITDATGDAIMGRNMNSLNLYEVVDAGFAGMIGAGPTISVTSLASNVGHSRIMKNRQAAIEVLASARTAYEAESDPALRKVYQDNLVKAMANMQLISQEEVAMYSTLNPQEKESVIKINQELSRIQEAVNRGQYWNGEKISKDEKKALEQRYESFLKEKTKIEEAALTKAEKEAEEPVMAEDSNNEEVATEPQEQNKKEADKRKETPVAPKAAPEEQIQEEKALSEFDETKDPEVKETEEAPVEEAPVEEDELAFQDTDPVKKEFYEVVKDDGEKTIAEVTTAKNGQRTIKLKTPDGDITERVSKDVTENTLSNENYIDGIVSDVKSVSKTKTVEGFENIANKKGVEKRKKELAERKAKETAKEPESKETFDIEVDGATNLIGDTENVGDGKGQMSLRVAQAIDNLTKGFKKKGVVKKIKFYKNPKDIGNYSAAVAKEIADGYTVGAFYDPSTGTIVLTSESKVKEVKEEFGHAHLVDIIGKDAASRIKLYKELKAKSKKSKDIKKILEDVEDTYKSEVTNEDAVESLKNKGKDSPTAKEISSEKAKLEEEIQKTVEEESIIKILRESKKFLKEGFLNKIIRMINTMFKNRGGKGNIITGHEDLSKLARKFEMATKGVETEVKVDEAEADPLVRKKGESLADFNTRLEEIATEKLKFEETEESKKQQEFEESAKSLNFSKKKEFTYLKDTELYYTDVISRVNQFTGVSTVKSVKEKSVNVNDYFHYRNLWAKLTGNGQETSRMEDVYFITKDADGNEKRHNVKPPKPKTDREGNVLNMPTQMTFNERRIKDHFEKEELDRELTSQRALLDKNVTDLWMNSSKKINLFTDFQDFFPQTEGSQSIESEIENFIIAKKNLLALITSDVSSDNLRDLKGNKDKINPNVNPEIFNMSGISKFGESEVDTEVQDIQDTDREVNPDATSSIKFSKKKATSKKVYRSNITSNKEGNVRVSNYKGKPSDLNKSLWKDIVKGFSEGKVFNVAWDQVAAATFTLSGGNTRYSTSSGIEELTTSSFGKGVSFRTAAARKQFINKVKDIKGKIYVSISLNGKEMIMGNPLLFDAVLDNVFKQVEAGNITEDAVLAQANKIWNQRQSYKTKEGDTVYKLSGFDAIDQSENNSPFFAENANKTGKVLIKKTEAQSEEGIQYEWTSYEALVEGTKLFTEKSNRATLRLFSELGNGFVNKDFVEGTVLPDLKELQKNLILPEYTDAQGNPVKAGTIVAVMEIDLDKMRTPSGRFITKIDEGSSFPYTFTGGLTDIKLVRDQPTTEAAYRIVVGDSKGSVVGEETKPASAANVARGTAEVTSKLRRHVSDKEITKAHEDVQLKKESKKQKVTKETLEIYGLKRRKNESEENHLKRVKEARKKIKYSKTKGIDTEGSTEIFETDQGPFELRTMSAYQRVRNRFLQKFANKYQYIFNIQEDIVKSKDGKLKESQDFEMAETRMYGKAANDLELLKDKVKDITADIKQKGLNIEEVELYLYAQHAKERNAVILERSNGKDVSGSGITDARADEILNSMDKAKKAKIEEVAKKIREIQQNTRDTMVEFGLESQETVDVLENLFKNYVPLGGLAQDEKDSFSSSYPTGGAGMHVYGSTFKKASGRKSEAPNILAQIISQNASVHIKGRTNEALQSLYELVEQNPNKNVWSIVNKPNDVDPHTIAVRVDGKQRYIRFVDASYAETLRGLNAPATSMFGNMMAKPARWLRASFTTLSPEFMISNFSRDIQSALFNAAAESDIEGGRLDGEQVVQDMIKMVPSTLKALLKPKVGMEADPLMQRYYDEYKADGGKTGWAYTQKISDIAKDLEKESKDKSKMQELLGAPKNLANFVEGINDAFENSIRLAAYVAAREKGISRGKAAQFSKNVTVNFNRHGEWGQALNGVYMFFNASVQGSMVLGRSLATLKPATKPDGSKRAGLERVNNAQRLAFGLFLFSGLVTMMNRAMSDEDEDGVIFYDKIPDYIKERNMIIMNPRNGKDYYKIPLPYGYSLFSSLGSTVVDVTDGGKDWDEALMFLSSSTINAFSPVSFGQSKDLFNHVGKSATPTVLKPIVDVMTNETYFGSPVYAAQSPYGVPKSESAMAFRSPKGVQDFFEWMNDATGGSEYKSGWADMNPDKPWYMFEYAIGGAGKFVKRSGELVTKLAAKVENNDFKIAANDVPFLRILYGEASKYYDSGKYNEAKIDITQLSKEYKEDRKLGDPSRYKGVLILKDRLDKYERQLKVLRKKEREARKIENFTERSIRIQELRDKKNKIFMQFNRAYENIRKNE